MTQICVFLTGETTPAVVARLAALAHSADLFEIRGDLVRGLDLLTILRAKKRPLIFSCRTVAGGGRYDAADDRRRLLLLEAVKRGYETTSTSTGRAAFTTSWPRRRGAG